MTYYYTAFGLSISSQLEFSELLPIDPAPTDLTITLGKTPNALAQVSVSNFMTQANETEYLLQIQDVANYYIVNNYHITIELLDESNLPLARSYFLGTVLGALLARRGFFTLHSSAINVNGKAILFCGKSGAGKSTTAAYFEMQGHPLISDDICPIYQDAQGKVFTHSGIPQMKLWQDAINHFGIPQTDSLKRLIQRNNKFARPLSDSFHQHPTEVAKIFFLQTNRKNEFTIEKLRSDQKISQLNLNAYLSNTFAKIKSTPKWFFTVTSIASKTDCYLVTRPDQKTIDEKYYKMILEAMRE
jgi:hypothetical protein